MGDVPDIIRKRELAVPTLTSRTMQYSNSKNTNELSHG